MITVMGATGRTGRRIVEQLLRAGESVRALGRSSDRLAPLARLGAQAVAGDPADVSYLANAFRGATAVYTLQPYELGAENYNAAQAKRGEAIVAAIRAVGTCYVVTLGSLGADLREGTGTVLALRAQEDRLRRIDGLNALVLRAAAFMDNIGAMLPWIERQGAHGGAHAPHVALPMVAARDVADVAARALVARDFIGFTVREVLGQRDLSYTQATRIIGERLGTPGLPYVQLPDEEALAALSRAGFSESLARLHIELAHAVNAGRVRSLEQRRAFNTTPTSFEAYVDALVRERDCLQNY